MALSAPRLTIYALLSAVEEDLRGMIIEFLAEDPHGLLGEKLHLSAQRRHEDENGPVNRSLTLEEILPYTDLGDLVQILNRRRVELPEHVAKGLEAVNSQLQLLMPVRKRVAHIRPFRYDDLARVTGFTDQVSAHSPANWPSVTETVARLGQDPAFVFDLPQPRYEEPPDSAFHNLPLPEFDDTGFLGRDSEVRSVLSLCKGAWPVVTLVGEGGLGKTALALRCAYDLLDDEASPFDAIIWSTSKTTRLDPTQIREIDGAIRDSIGLFEHVASELGSTATESEATIDEILSYLGTFKVLLILDNLETVIDERIRSFLGRLPTGSKILITSRIGVGEFEYRVDVQPLPNVEAARLLRAVAKVSGVTDLAKMSEQQLGDMCTRMQNNPLFIKWFVAAVQSGTSPEQALVKPDLFLDFCMSNVYEHLSQASQELLKALLASPHNLSLPELIYFNNEDAHETQGAVQELLTTNMLAMSTNAQRTVETRYRLTDLARLYLTKHHPLTPDEDRTLDRARRRLADDERKISHEISGNPYEPRTIATRSDSDLLVVRPLLDALRYADANDFGAALAAVEKAKTVTPDYFECFRIEAQVHAAARNVAVADSAFRSALDLADDTAALNFFYAQFLRTARRDLDKALDYISRALMKAPDAPRILLESVRCHMETLSFTAARESLTELLFNDRSVSPAVAREMWQLNIEFWITKANFSIQTRGYLDALSALESMRRDIEGSPPSVLPTIRRQLSGAFGSAWCSVEEAPDEAVKARATAFLEWLKSQKGVRVPSTVPISDELSFGTIRFADQEKQFGFIGTDDYGDVFFHRSACVVLSDFDLMKAGVGVSYRSAASEKGRKALDVAIG